MNDLEPYERGYMDHEGTPTLGAVPGVDLDDYKATLIERLSNPEVRDTVTRLCAESSDRIPKWLLPVVRHTSSTTARPRSAAVGASWARYAEGPTSAVSRSRSSTSSRTASPPTPRTARSSRDRELFGDLADNHRFRAAYEEALNTLHEHGAHRTLERYQSV